MANITNGAPINANYVPKFASATSINNSAIYQNGSNIGIGTTTPAVTLDVAGIIQMTGFKLPVSPVAGYVLTSDSGGVGTWKAPGIGGSGTTNFLPKFTAANTVANSVISESGGNIGIGAATPGSKL